MKLFTIIAILLHIVISGASLIASSICEKCQTFSDGCNTCRCSSDTPHISVGCTRRVCLADVEKAGCRLCRDGYQLNPDTYVCESTVCGGIEHCATLSDLTKCISYIYFMLLSALTKSIIFSVFIIQIF